MPLTQVNSGLLESGSALANIGSGNITPAYLNTQAQYTGFKNRIINGGMGIWQRGTSSSSGTANSYLADRFLLVNWTSASQSSDVPSNQGFQYSIEFTNSSPTYPLIGQRIESSNCRDLAGQTVTVSYWAKNVSGSAILYSEIYIANSADNFSSLTPVGTVQASAANPSSSWTYYSGSITLPAGAANGIQLNVVRNNASVAVTRVTGVQLEKGSTATSFDYRPYGTELALCQRYYLGTEVSVGNYFYTCLLRPDGYRLARYFYPVEMRTAATATLTWNSDGSGVSYSSVIQTKQFFQCLSASPIATSTVVPYITAFSASAEL